MNICETNWDVAIVGAGPAGSYAALQLALRGYRTLILEKSPWPREKVCGGCLSPLAVNLLRHAGLSRALLHSAPLDSVVWHTGKRSLEIPSPGGAAIFRANLDSSLIEEAQLRGCTFLPETSATLLPASHTDAHRTLNLQNANGKTTIRANIVLACDGINGTLLANEPWATWQIARHAWMGVSTTLSNWPNDPRPSSIHMHIGDGGYVGLVRLPDSRIHLAAALNPTTCKSAGGPARLVQQILHSCNLSTDANFLELKFRGTTLLTRKRAHLGDHRVLTIGDAAGYIEPFTGEGMAWALRGAQQVAALLPAPNSPWPADLPEQWQTLHEKIIGRRQRWCKALKPMMHHPILASAGIMLGRSMPAIGNFLARQICRDEGKELNNEPPDDPSPAQETAQSAA
jgi:flavin-dependent dehydrogenase